jgi:hypothetical protein
VASGVVASPWFTHLIGDEQAKDVFETARQPLRSDRLSTRRTSRRSCSPSADGVTGETVVVDGARAITY